MSRTDRLNGVRFRGRRSAAAGFAFLLALVAGVFSLSSATPASAAVALVTCTGSEDVTFDPPLTNTTQETEVRVRGSLDCNQVVPPASFTGDHKAKFIRDYSCLTLLGGGQGERVIRWSDGSTSTFEFQSSNQAANGQFIAVRTGEITSGRFAGHAAEETGVGLGDLTACQGAGLDELQTTVTFVII
jgi:hypothetical protein